MDSTAITSMEVVMKANCKPTVLELKMGRKAAQQFIQSKIKAAQEEKEQTHEGDGAIMARMLGMGDK